MSRSIGQRLTDVVSRWKFGEPVIVVSGLPRSGTSMLMNMLSAGGMPVFVDDQRHADRDNVKGYFEYERVKGLETDPDRSWLRQARGQAIKVVSHLLRYLPPDNRYRVLLARRDLTEVLASQNLMLERLHQANPVSDDKARRHYEQHLRGVRSLVGVRSNFQLPEVPYAEVIAGADAWSQKISAFVGRDLDRARMAAVVDASLYRNRRKHGEIASVVAPVFLLAVFAPTAEAYIGPGAGFALAGSFLAVFSALLAGIMTILTWPVRHLIRHLRRRKSLAKAKVGRVVVLGLDGLDPNLAEKWIGEQYLPNLARLQKEGSFNRLRTTYPSISPVAWASFMTGVSPGRHNIFDFLNRDPKNYTPKLSSSDVRPSTRTIRIGDWVLPVGRPLIRNMRKSRAFWSILGDHGIPCNILRVPLTFPPEKFAGVLLSAMCIPDLRGTQGSFTFYTSNPEELASVDSNSEAAGGERVLLKFDGNVAEAELAGPSNTMRRKGGRVQLPFRVELRPDRQEAIVKIGRKSITLREREYSDWIQLTFKPLPFVAAHGIARFYVTNMSPDNFGLYVTPINIDPARPALPISWPGIYSIYLSKIVGEFATLGLAEDTWALNERVIDEQAFLQQTLDLHRERETMFFDALDKTREGVVACVFDGTDRLQHMFFRYLDADHPANRGKDVELYKNAIRDMYQQADGMVGKVLAQMKPDDLFLVISDHGFQSFKRGVNVNTWLLQNGLLSLKEGRTEGGEWFDGIDWSRTKAYAFGLAGTYINQAGREGQGIVQPGEETERVKRQIMDGLSGLVDPKTGETAINEMFDNLQVHHAGPYLANGPDLIVGYNRGYRASWEAAVGRVTREVITDNTKSWSGDHCIDPRLVPGVLFSSRAISAADPGITDLAPTILDLFGVAVPAHMTGSVLEVDFGRAAAVAPAPG
jgi:predicted AlkP superfamily phosphohydrolase/phosphomutase